MKKSVLGLIVASFLLCFCWSCSSEPSPERRYSDRSTNVRLTETQSDEITFGQIASYVGLGVVGILAVVLLFGMFYTVEQQQVAIIQRLGKFVKLGHPGLNTKIPFIDQVAGEETLRVQPLDVEVETKTKDDVFVKLLVTVQYYVLPDKVYDAFYKLENPEGQIRSFVFGLVRAKVPSMKLDEVFEKKDEVANAVKEELTETMNVFGYGIDQTQVTNIDPDEKVKAAMNEINAAQRMRIAANEKGEADKILKVKAAEAEAQSKALQGKGIADQRKAIVEGLRDSVDEFQKAVQGSTAQDVMQLVLLTQYFDTLKEIGASSRSNTILIPHSPGHLMELGSQIRDAMITADQVGKAAEVPNEPVKS